MQQRLLFPALSLVMVVTALVSGLGTPLVPSMVDHFGVPLEAAQWVITIPMLSAAVCSPLLGRLGAPGRQRRLILVCLGLVAFGLVLSAVPLGFTAMLVGRALQGIGLALAPIVMAIARRLLGTEASLPVIANLSAAVVIAAVVSYPLSSLIADLAGLEAAYWFGLLLTLATLLLAWVAIPRETAVGRVSVDWLGALLLAAGSGALLLLCSLLQSWSAWWSAGMGIAATAFVALWVLRSMRVADPLIDLRLAVRPRVLVSHLVAVVNSVGSYMILVLVMLAGQDEAGAHLPLALAGFLLVPYSIMSAVTMKLGNVLRGRLSLLTLLILSTAAFALSCLLLAVGYANGWALLAGAAIGGIGGGWTFSILPQLIVQQVPQEETASALSFNMLLRNIGNGVGIALCPVLIALGVQVGVSAGGYEVPFLCAATVLVAELAALLVYRARVTR